MLIDARTIEANATLNADLCIIGAGAAGITIARELADSGLQVCVLESGGHKPERATQKLYAGSIRPGFFPADSDYLQASRVRCFGGSTHHWQGWCRPLDTDDFELRPWVADSGWPITRAMLDPYYRRAATLCEVAPFPDDDDRYTVSARRPTLPGISDAGLEHRVFHFSPKTRFAAAYGPGLQSAANTTVVLHANVTQISAASHGEHIRTVQAATLGNKRFRVSARAFVLATGGLENPRLLLSSDDVHSRGLGNRYDLVGRYFMEHTMRSRALTLALTAPPQSLELYQKVRLAALGHRVRAYLRFTPQLQAHHELLNMAFSFRTYKNRHRSAIGKAVARSSQRLAGDGSSTARHHLRFMTELVPKPNNRVQLTGQRDRLGMRKLELSWNQSATDIDSIERSMHLLAQKIGAAGIGRIRILPVEDFGTSAHHMGTTRMHDDARRGVVDAQARVHGIDNLYVAGSSVFPTSGFANPTLTIVALALRLADRLRKQLERRPVGPEIVQTDKKSGPYEQVCGTTRTHVE